MATTRQPTPSKLNNHYTYDENNWLVHLVHTPVYYQLDQLETYLILEGFDRYKNTEIFLQLGYVITTKEGNKIIIQDLLISEFKPEDIYSRTFRIERGNADNLIANVKNDQHELEQAAKKSDETALNIHLMFKTVAAKSQEHSKVMSYDWSKKMLSKVLPQTWDQIKDLKTFKASALHIQDSDSAVTKMFKTGINYWYNG